MSLGISTGLRALLAARNVMDIIGHNLANQNTPGYSRQIGLLQTTLPVTSRRLINVGTGVSLVDVYSVVNDSLLARIRTEVSQTNRFAAESALMTQMESILGDLSENGLAQRLQSMFDSSSKAGTAPEDLVLRQNFLNNSSELALSFRTKVSELQSMRNSSIFEAQTIVATSNQLLSRVGDLNVRIKNEEALGVRANDLRDQRSVALEQLSGLIGSHASALDDGTMNVSVNGTTLVTGGSVLSLAANIDQTGDLTVSTANGSLEVRSPGGTLGGVLDMVTDFIPQRLDELNQVAHELIYEMNRVHSRGVPSSGPFTQLTSAYPVSVQQGIDPKTVALGSAGLPFDLSTGSLSIAVSDLASGDVDRHEIAINPSATTVQGLLDSINAIPELSAFLDGTGKLHINAVSGHGFDFSKRLDSNPVEGGTFGSDSATLVAESFPAALTNGDQLTVSVDGGPAQTVTFNSADFADINNATADEVAAVFNSQVSGVNAAVVDGRLTLRSGATGSISSLTVVDGAGTPAADLGLPLSAFGSDSTVDVNVTGSTGSEQARHFTFRASGDGKIGLTPGLEVEVYENGQLLTTLQVGEGYEPGEPLEVVEGVYVDFSPGAIQGSANQFFTLDTPGDTDSADLLAAFGLNALFSGSDASSIRLDRRLEGHPELLAGAASGGPGDGDNFLALANVALTPLAGLGDNTIIQYYNGFAARVGTAAAGANSSLESSGLVLLTLQSQRAAESGVSQDEELLNLERFQDAYQAAAKYLSVVANLDEVLINL